MQEIKMMTANEIFDKAMVTMSPLPSQVSCVRDLAAIFSFHLTKVELMDAGFSADELPQQHAIMVAPTGAGKTYLLRHIARACGVNLICLDGSSMSRDGWKGPSFGQQLLAAQTAAGNATVFERSVLFVDEADKMRLYHDRNDAGNVMDNLLQLFNNGEVAVETEGKTVQTINVSRFTIIMGGAFSGLEAIIRKRMASASCIGFGSTESRTAVDDKTILHNALPKDLEAYGIKKELIGRIGSIVHINPLGVEDYRCLLTSEVRSVQANYRNYFSHGFGVDFDITNEAIRRIAEQCAKATTGARAINPIVNQVLRQAIFDISKDNTINKVVLTADDNTCFVQYEHGERGTSDITDFDFDFDKPYCVSGESVNDICINLFGELPTRKLEYVEKLGPFVRMTLTYLFDVCHPSERTLDNLRKLATATDKSAKGFRSSYEIIISDYLCRPDHNAEMDDMYHNFRRNWLPNTCQELCKGLTALRRHFIIAHGTSNIVFHINEEQETHTPE